MTKYRVEPIATFDVTNVDFSSLMKERRNYPTLESMHPDLSDIVVLSYDPDTPSSVIREIHKLFKERLGLQSIALPTTIRLARFVKVDE